MAGKHPDHLRLVPPSRDRRPALHQPQHLRILAEPLKGEEAVDDLPHAVANGIVIEMGYSLGQGSLIDGPVLAVDYQVPIGR